MVQLRKPAAQPAPAQPEATQGSTARFIAAGDSRPVTKKSLPTNFRLTPEIIAILDEQAAQSGQNKTTILKAAILAYHHMTENERNAWLLEAPKY